MRAALRAAEAMAGRSADQLRLALRELEEAVAKLKDTKKMIARILGRGRRKEEAQGGGDEHGAGDADVGGAAV